MLRSLHRSYPSLHPSQVVHWVPEQLNIKAVAGACKLIDGCSLALCSASFSGISWHMPQKIKSIQLHDSIEGLSQEIVSITLHYCHYITKMFLGTTLNSEYLRCVILKSYYNSSLFNDAFSQLANELCA